MPSHWDASKLERGYVLASQDEYAPEAPGNEECLAYFLEWLRTDGAELQARWLAGETIPEDEARLLWVARAAWIWRGDRLLMRRRRGFDPADADEAACADYVEKLEQRGSEAMKRGYFGEQLSAEDMVTLREYRILADARILGLPVWPYELGIQERSGARGTPQKYLPLGSPMPDLKWPRMEALLNSPHYTDRPTRHPRAVMLPDAVEDFLSLFRGYQVRQAADGRRFVVGVPPDPGDDPENTVALRSFRGRKPVALFVASATDCFWARAVAYLRSIQAAYDEKIEFIWVNIRLWDFLIHSLTTRNYFVPHVGTELPPFQRTLEERARWAKKLYMTYPDLALSCVLDDVCDTTASFFQEGGGSATVVLVDIDGRVAWHSPGWGWWHSQRPPGGSASDAWADALEREMCHLLERGGHYDPDHPPFDEPDRSLKRALPEGARECYLAPSRITGVERDARRLTIYARPVARFTVLDRPPDVHDFYNDPQPIDVAIADETRVTFRNAPMPWSSLQPGDVVDGPVWRLADGTWVARHLQVRSCANPPAGVAGPVFAGQTCMSGRIVSVQPDRQTFVVECLLPPLAQMKGYRFNREAGDAIRLYGAAKVNMDAVSRWVANPGARYTFEAHEDMLLSLNGKPATLAGVRPGDIAGVWYDAGEEGSDVIRAGRLRASRPPGRERLRK